MTDEEVVISFYGEKPTYFNNKLFRIGNKKVEYFDGKLYKVGNDRIRYWAGRLDKIGDNIVMYYAGKVCRVGNVLIRDKGKSVGMSDSLLKCGASLIAASINNKLKKKQKSNINDETSVCQTNVKKYKESNISGSLNIPDISKALGRNIVETFENHLNNEDL